MLDLQFICDNKDAVAENCRNRGAEVNIGKVVELRDRRSRLIQTGDQLRHDQKETSAKIPTATDPDEKQSLIARGKELRAEVAANEAELKQLAAELRAEQAQIPNMTHPAAPIGRIEEESVTLRTWGEIPQFDFKPLDHVELAEKHDLIDFEAGARVAGHGFYFLKNEAVLLELALQQYAMELLVRQGFVPMITPDLARGEILQGIGFIPRGPETQIYSIENHDLNLVATAEITLGGLYSGEVIDAEQLPIKLCGISHCFRTEAGAAGRASRGLYRVHQFTKIEMFAFTLPEQSDDMHNYFCDLECQLFDGLRIPYRVIDTASGDLGGPAYRKFDLEAWMPGRGKGGEFGEVTSASNCTDYQARRLNIRYKVKGEKGTRLVHTLNGTAVAISRALIAILENCQQPDGTVVIPEVLRKWVGKDRIGSTE